MSTASDWPKVFVGLVLFLGLYSCQASAEITKLPDDARAALMHEQDFAIIKKVDRIPPVALQTIRDSKEFNEFKMADAGGRFQTTDVITVEGLPWRQLQFAALSSDYLLIHHARGGIGLGYYFVLLKKTGDKFTIIWIAAGPQCPDLQHFIASLKSNKIDDASRYNY